MLLVATESGVTAMSKPRQACVDCHFFITEVRAGRDPSPSVVTKENREKSRANDYSWHTHGSIACYMGVWDQGGQFDMAKRHEVIVMTERQDFCFFWPYHPGMFLPAARELQQREMARKEADRGLRLTRRSLYVAVAALVASAALTLLDILLK